MRKIKFRAWVKHYKMVLDVLFIDFENNLVHCNFHGNEADPWEFDFEEIVFLQFTGLYDKNGKEIYEGDVLRCYDHWTEPEDREEGEEMKFDDYEVAWFDDYPAFDLKGYFTECPHNGLQDVMLGETYEHYEVTGNIYQKPELIKE